MRWVVALFHCICILFMFNKLLTTYCFEFQRNATWWWLNCEVVNRLCVRICCCVEHYRLKSCYDLFIKCLFWCYSTVFTRVCGDLKHCDSTAVSFDFQELSLFCSEWYRWVFSMAKTRCHIQKDWRVAGLRRPTHSNSTALYISI